MNGVPHSETMSSGMPWSPKTCWAMSLVVLKAEGSLIRSTKYAVLVKQSTLVRITVLPSNRRRPVTKPRAMWDQGQPGVDNGQRKPAGGWLLFLSLTYMGQAETNFFTSWNMNSHPKKMLLDKGEHATNPRITGKFG